MTPGGRSLSRSQCLARVLLASAALLFVLAAACRRELVERRHWRQPLSTEAIEETARSAVVFLVLALVLVALALVLRRSNPIAAWFDRRGVARATLAVLFLVVPVVVVDRALRPFVERATTIYARDPDLGWQNRPLAEDTYWGARVRINSRGMRGPERAEAKPAGVRRVLLLGDSVVFGLAVEDDARTLPARLEQQLARTGTPFECLNAAVCGWSTWQHERYLQRSGDSLAPDLVVVGFVLNDVTERFDLRRFGGTGEGAQLAYTRETELSDVLAESGILLYLRERAVLRAALRLAAPGGVRLDAHHLIFQPEAREVRSAWHAVQDELAAIDAWCRSRSIPLALAVFPYSVQISRPDADAPQRRLAQFARERGIAFCDLLPPLVAAARARGVGEEALFFDALHLTELGHEIAADALAGWLVELGVLR